jgi:hypothetical protein
MQKEYEEGLLLYMILRGDAGDGYSHVFLSFRRSENCLALIIYYITTM